MLVTSSRPSRAAKLQSIQKTSEMLNQSKRKEEEEEESIEEEEEEEDLERNVFENEKKQTKTMGKENVKINSVNMFESQQEEEEEEEEEDELPYQERM